MAASPRHVAPLPPSGGVGDGPYQFLGDYPTAVPIDQLPAGRCWWLCGGRSWIKNVSPRLAGAATASVARSGVLTLPAWARLVPLLATCRRLYKVASQAVTGVGLLMHPFAPEIAVHLACSVTTRACRCVTRPHRKKMPFFSTMRCGGVVPTRLPIVGFCFLESCCARCPQWEWSRFDGWCFNR